MESDPNGDEKVSGAEPEGLTSAFPGQLRNVTDARLVADDYLRELARTSPPGSAEHWDDVLLVVTELAANTVQYATAAPRRPRLAASTRPTARAESAGICSTRSAIR
jgi:anti-sigma regulatory factor (Ser/Thr protein kinase)